MSAGIIKSKQHKNIYTQNNGRQSKAKELSTWWILLGIACITCSLDINPAPAHQKNLNLLTVIHEWEHRKSCTHLETTLGTVVALPSRTELCTHQQQTFKTLAKNMQEQEGCFSEAATACKTSMSKINSPRASMLCSWAVLLLRGGCSFLMESINNLNNIREICQVCHYTLYWAVQSKKT